MKKKSIQKFTKEQLDFLLPMMDRYEGSEEWKMDATDLYKENLIKILKKFHEFDEETLDIMEYLMRLPYVAFNGDFQCQD